MNSLIIDFYDDVDINNAYNQAKKIFPNTKIIKNPNLKDLEKIKHNAEYIEKLEKAIKELDEGKGIAVEMEELDTMEKMTPEEMKIFAEKVRKRGKA